MLPSAFATLWFLAAFLGLWGISLVLRARERWRLAALGVVVIAVAGACAYVGQLVSTWPHRGIDPRRPLGGIGAWEAGAWGVAAFGLALAAWAWRGDRSHGRKRCPKCWYDMTGVGLKCPECGHEAKAVKQLYRARRRRWTAALGVMILVSSYGLWIVPRVMAGGWVAAVPTTVLIAGMPWLPDSMIVKWFTGTREEDWTLSGRLTRKRLWGFQSRWLAARAEATIRGVPDVWVLGRAIAFVRDVERAKSVAPQARLAVARGLIDPSPAVRERASQCARLGAARLADLGGAPGSGARESRETIEPLIGDLIVALDDPSEGVAGAAAEVLGQCGPRAERAAPRLIEMMGSRRNRRAAVWALRDLAPESEFVRRTLIQAFGSGDPETRRGAMSALANPEVHDPGVIESLLRVVRDGDDEDAERAAFVLSRMRAPAALAVPVLLEQLDTRRAVRESYVGLLIAWRRELGPWMPRIIDLLNDETDELKYRVMNLLAETANDTDVDLSGAVPALEALRAGPSQPLSSEAANVLGFIRIQQQRATAVEPNR